MDLPLALVLLVVALAGVGLVVWFRLATRRMRAVMEAARRQHRLTLERLRETESPVAWEALVEDTEGWTALHGEVEGVQFALGASRGLGGDTKFIDLVTRLEVEAPGLDLGRLRFRMPEDAAGLRELGLSDQQIAALVALTYELRLETGRLRTAARPAGATVYRYSYGVRLTLDHELLLRLIAVGVDAVCRLSNCSSSEVPRAELK